MKPTMQEGDEENKFKSNVLNLTLSLPNEDITFNDIEKPERVAPTPILVEKKPSNMGNGLSFHGRTASV